MRPSFRLVSSVSLLILLVACDSEPTREATPVATPNAPVTVVTKPASAPASEPATAASMPASSPAIPAALPVAMPPLDTKAAAAQLKKLPKRKYGKDVPKWAKTPIKIDEKKHVILAVGVAPAGKINLQLGRDAAENRARAMIVKLREGKPELDPEPFAGTLQGAQMVDSFTSKKDGNIYVLVEAPL